MYHGSQIRKLKTLVNVRLEDNPTAAAWRETAELHLEPGELQNYYGRKSNEARRLSGIQQSDGISDWARKWGLPSDLCHRSGKKRNEDDMEEATNGEDMKSSDEDNNDNYNGEEEDSTTTMSSKKNYYKEVNQKLQLRREMEETASNGQKKQAVAVNGRVVKCYLRGQSAC